MKGDPTRHAPEEWPELDNAILRLLRVFADKYGVPRAGDVLKIEIGEAPAGQVHFTFTSEPGPLWKRPDNFAAGPAAAEGAPHA